MRRPPPVIRGLVCPTCGGKVIEVRSTTPMGMHANPCGHPVDVTIDDDGIHLTTR